VPKVLLAQPARLEIKDYQVPLVIPEQQVPKDWLVQPARPENKDYPEQQVILAQLVLRVLLERLGHKATQEQLVIPVQLELLVK
jgi:hypothetical protein